MKPSRFLYYTILALLLVVFLGSSLYVGRYILDSRASKESYDSLSSLVAQHRQEPAPTQPPAPTEPGDSEPEATEPVMLPEYAALYELNPDVVGWMQIEGTPVNYPVMQTPESVDYYLKRNFDRQSDARGCLYAAESCDIDAPSDNIIIYGHHMNDGSMFGSLKKYLKESFWQEHPTIRFDTLYEYHSYEIFAVFRTSATEGAGFAYHQFIDAADEAAFDAFVATCRELALYDTGILPVYGDKLICLSTCEYTRENGRLVVMAVRKD